MDEDLKPCPFCGGRARIIFSGKTHADYWRGVIIAKCLCCGASARGAFYEGDPIEEIPLELTVGAEIAEENWNRRI